jgi:hypothetical protein
MPASNQLAVHVVLPKETFGILSKLRAVATLSNSEIAPVHDPLADPGELVVEVH